MRLSTRSISDRSSASAHMGRTAAPKSAEKAPEVKTKSAADAGEDFSIEDILAEFKDL